MRNTLDFISFRTELGQSELYAKVYEDFFNVLGSNPTDSYWVTDIVDLLDKIISEFTELTSFQKDILIKIFNAFNNIRKLIDPKRLSAFEYSFTDDDELILYRNTDNGLANVIINPDECFAFSFISKNDTHKSLDFYDENFNDFEGVAYQFFS